MNPEDNPYITIQDKLQNPIQEEPRFTAVWLAKINLSEINFTSELEYILSQGSDTVSGVYFKDVSSKRRDIFLHWDLSDYIMNQKISLTDQTKSKITECDLCFDIQTDSNQYIQFVADSRFTIHLDCLQRLQEFLLYTRTQYKSTLVSYTI